MEPKSTFEERESKLDQILELELAFKKRVDHIDRKNKKHNKKYSETMQFAYLAMAVLVGFAIGMVVFGVIELNNHTIAQNAAILKVLNITPMP